jgi:hypothetical protein
VLRNIGADHRVGNAEQPRQQARDLGRQPVHSAPGPVGEGHHTDSVVGGREDLRVEAGQYPVVLDRKMATEVGPEEPQSEARYPGIRLVLRLEHHRHRRRLEH